MADVEEPVFSFSYGGETKYLTKEERANLVDALYELRVSVKCVRKMMTNVRYNFRAVHFMLATSGFSWDPEKLCVVAEDHVWDSFPKTSWNWDAFYWKTLSFPHYDKLRVIFNDNIPMGFQTNVLEGEKGVDKNQINPFIEVKDLMDEEDVHSTRGVNETTGCKRKRYEENESSKSCEESSEKMNNAIDDFKQTLTEILEKMATKRVNEDTDLMNKVMTQMSDLPTLTLDERLKTMSVIGRSASLSFMYDRLDEDEKIRMAQLVSRGSIS
ncbi:uncharacterized protein [Rutidosis leptorrhynchoides]|uniref:uncharacterized protein isoform X2 n=1 Tax=Rutidosis leptorrhynchoides TaxID=125765 RepID=UPI003A997B1F